MKTDDMILISIDDHVVEPPDMFRAHLPARYMDQAPHIVQNEEGMDQWVYEGQEMAMVGLNAVVSWPKQQWGFNPTAHAEMRPGAYNVHERIRDMNRNGVLASMCFPSMAGFSGRTFQEAKDKELALVMLKAYNDWHIDEWCGAYPGRFIPQAILPIWDMDATVTELRRVAEKGARAVTMPELPHVQGLPSYHSDSWDPFFSAMCDLDLVMSLHIGQGLNAINLPDINFDEYMVLSTQVTVLAVQDLLWGHVMRQFPDLKIAFSEGGISWVPMLIDRITYVLDHSAVGSDGWDDKTISPIDALRRNFWFCTIDLGSTFALRDHIGIDHICIESDFPHADSTWPDTQPSARKALQGLPDDVVRKVTWENASKLFRHPVPPELQIP